MNRKQPREIAKELWTLADFERSHGRPFSRFQDFLLPVTGLFFLRWATYMEAEQEAIAAFDEASHEPALPSKLHWKSWSHLRGQELTDFLEHQLVPRLRHAGPTPLAQQLQRAAEAVHYLHGTEQRIRDALMNWVADFNFEDPEDRECAGDVIEHLLYEFSMGSDTGQYVTPRSVVELMVELANPQPDERVYDPSFGTGGLLVQAVRRAKDLAKRYPPTIWKHLQTASVFGVEKNVQAYFVGLTRIVLEGIHQPGLECGDALERPSLQGQGKQAFDCVLAVPPWGGRPRPETSRNYYDEKNASSEVLFLAHIMQSLRPGGRAVVALPDGALFRSGPDRRARQQLLTECRVEGVIALPERSFEPYTALRANLLVFTRESPRKTLRFLTVNQPVLSQTSLAAAVGLERRRAGGELHARSAPSGGKLGVTPLDVVSRFRSPRATADAWDAPIASLAKRDWELIAKRSGDEELDKFLDRVKSADVSTQVSRLGKLADVFHQFKFLFKEKGPEHAESVTVHEARFVHVGEAGAKGGTGVVWFLKDAELVEHNKDRLLRPGDVLVSRTGTIGRVMIVTEELVGAVPYRGIVVVRVRENVSPQYLVAYLRSTVAQEWLTGHATGSTVQHLSVRALKELPVPVPSLSIQERLVKETKDSATDAHVRLLTLLTARENDPVAEWLLTDQALRAFLSSHRPAQEEADWRALHGWLDHLRAVRNRVAHQPSPGGDPHLQHWVLFLSNAAERLRGLEDVPKGTGRFALISHVLSTLQQWQPETRDDTATDPTTWSLATKLTDRLKLLLASEADRVAADVRIEATPGVPYIPTESITQIAVRIANTGTAPIRNLHIVTIPDVGHTDISFLTEGAHVTFPVFLGPNLVPGQLSFRVHWSGERLDGRSIEGEVPLSIEVRPVSQVLHDEDLGPSPYIVGKPIDRDEMFFGRREILDKIKRQLSRTGQANVILLEGNRRTGKSSILRQLQKPGVLRGWIPVYCSLQAGEGDARRVGLPTEEVFRLMAKQIAFALHDAGITIVPPGLDRLDPERPYKTQCALALASYFATPRPFELFELFLQDVLRLASPQQVLLMLDEFDKLQEGIDSGVTSPQVPENIRYLLHTYPQMSAILTGSQTLKRLREEYWSALFGFGHHIRLQPLQLDEARSLVTNPVEGRLVYVPEARDRLIALCAYEPFLIQSLCNHVFERAASGKSDRTITLNAADDAAVEMVEDNEHFATLWGYAGSERRRFLLMLCDRYADGPDPVTFAFLSTQMEAAGIPLTRERQLGDDLDHLCRLGLTTRTGRETNTTYQLGIPLFRKWIGRYCDFDDSRERARLEATEDVA